MTAVVELSQLNPLVSLSVVNLSSEGGFVNVLAGTGDNDQVLSETAARVAMARVLHSLLCLHHVLISLGWNKLVALEHRVWNLIEVTSTNDEDLGV